MIISFVRRGVYWFLKNCCSPRERERELRGIISTFQPFQGAILHREEQLKSKVFSLPTKFQTLQVTHHFRSIIWCRVVDDEDTL